MFEINLPALQPGSSIMPGKVNPVMPELMNEICFKAIGNDPHSHLASQDGLLQLNAYGAGGGHLHYGNAGAVL